MESKGLLNLGGDRVGQVEEVEEVRSECEIVLLMNTRLVESHEWRQRWLLKEQPDREEENIGVREWQSRGEL